MARRRQRRSLETPRPINMRDLGEAMSFPGIDPRPWVSYALVDAEEPVTFDEEDYGPLVNVQLQPSDVPARCRVASSIAGDGEGEYHPFMGGDEVIVLLPHGRADADCVIVGRLNNARAKWPTSVAGQDSTKNAFGFSRKRTARLEEAAGPWMIRQAPSGALMTIDENGAITMRDGAGDALQISPDVFGFQDAGASMILQLDINGERCTIQAADARMILAGSGASPGNSSISVPKLLTIMTSANVAAEHAISTEAVANILVAFGALIAPAPVTPVQVAAAITTASSAPLIPAVGAAIQAAFAKQAQKLQGTALPASGQGMPGIGCQGLLIG